VKGDTEFIEPAAMKKRSVKQDLYAGALFVAYEEFHETNLKTNANLFARAEYSENALSRTDENDNVFGANIRGNNWFIYFEFLKNIHRCGNGQFGPWLCLNYNRVSHNEYSENCLFGDPSKAQTITSVNLDFLDTIIGVNIEGDFADQGINADENIDEKDVPMFKFFFKAGGDASPLENLRKSVRKLAQLS
jgi:hypothetical protein